MLARGSWLLVAVTMCVLFSNAGRDGLREPAPAFLYASAPATIYVELGRGFCPEGIHQFIDGYSRTIVRKLTLCASSDQGLLKVLETIPLQNGEKLEILVSAAHLPYLKRSWMAAASRTTLGITLHPDRMMFDDWLDIPGIGPVMAERIETDRQKNGEFGSPVGLKRVAGVGEHLVKKCFLQNDDI
jgi:competence protein ComEA